MAVVTILNRERKRTNSKKPDSELSRFNSKVKQVIDDRRMYVFLFFFFPFFLILPSTSCLQSARNRRRKLLKLTSAIRLTHENLSSRFPHFVILILDIKLKDNYEMIIAFTVGMGRGGSVGLVWSVAFRSAPLSWSSWPSD